jgi:hypothetical protein
MKLAGKASIGILAALILCGIAFAGSTKESGKLEGVIKDVETGKPIQNVYVSVDGCGTAAMTNDSGKFFLTEIPAGDCVVKIYKKGYRIHQDSVSIKKDKTHYVTVELKKQPVPEAGNT